MATWLILALLPLTLLLSPEAHAQTIVANFIAPDSICVNGSVTIANQTTGGSTYYWNFCSGNASNDPIGTNIGNPGNLLNVPVYPTLVRQGTDCFSFVNNQLGTSGLTRYYHGTSFSNDPISWQSFGNFGLITDSVEGMQIINDNGLWYGFICNGHRLVKLEFGASLWNNSPVATNLGPYDMFMGHGLKIIKEGNTWIGFVTCSFAGELGRFSFGNSLANLPSYTNLGNLATFVTPCQFNIIEENGLWYIILLSSGNNSICRLAFGNSLLNTPTGENLGNVGGLSNSVGMSVIRDCERTTAFYCNYVIPGSIGKIVFPNGVTGPATGQVIGNIGNLNRPNCFSEIIRENDSLLTYVTNRQNGTLTRLYFPPCTNATIPSSTLFNPPTYSYTQAGIYNVQLIVNEGQANQASLCKNIVVGPGPVANLGADKIICPGTTTTLNAGPGFSSYLWSTGAITSSIVVGLPGSYWVKVTKYGCEDYDTVQVSNYPIDALSLGPDTTICEGLTYTFDAGVCAGCSFVWSNLTAGLPNIGTGPTYTTGTAATYMATRTDANGCIKRDTATLSLSPPPVLTTSPLSQTICSGDTLTVPLLSSITGSTFSWTASGSSGNISGFSDGSGDEISQILANSGFDIETVTYAVTPVANGCTGIAETLVVEVFPLPDVYFNPVVDTICSGDTIDIFLLSHVTDSTFSWTATASSPDVTGFAADTGDQISQELMNSGTMPATVTYVVTPTANGCIGLADSITVLVKPRPEISFLPSSLAICSGAATVITISSQVPGTAFTWTAIGSSTDLTGFSDGSGPIIAQSLINNGFLEEQATYSVSHEADGCAGTDTSYIVSVFPVSDVFFVPNGDTVCSDQITNMILQSNVTGTAFAWTATGSSPAVSGFSSGSGSLIAQQLVNTNTFIESVTYLVQPEISGCPGTPSSVIIGVSTSPDVTLSLCHDTLTTTTAKPFPLRGGLPLHGTYMGNGISNDVLYPALAGAGTHLVTYSYSNANGCESQASQTMTIVNPTTHVCGDTVTDIRDGEHYPTTQIGTQCWFAKNLNYGIRTASSNLQRDNCIPEKFCFQYLAGKCLQYGGLYQWDEMMTYFDEEQVQGLCPPGWHIPSQTDWEILFNYYINNAFAAKPLLYSGYSGYNALLAGTRFINTDWYFEGFATMIWSSTSHGTYKAWAHGLNMYNHGVSYYPAYRLNAFSVRCLKD
ncbi:PKD-like domain-containing protein [Bacteroidota bacterium]